MQNRYVADVGDFGKYGLLRYLSGQTACDDLERLTLGLVWYMHHDERHGVDKTAVNRDGKHTGYLVRTPDDDRKEFRECDIDLWEKLRDLLFRDARCVHCAREMGILPDDTAFYDAQLYYLEGQTKAAKEARKATREHWFQGAKMATEGADLVCVDPDNGIAPTDKGMYVKDGPKHVYMPDLQTLWDRGQSLVIYQHVGRIDAEEFTREKAKTLKAGLACAEPIPLLFRPWSVRVFFVIPQPCQKELITARVCRMLDTPWNKHFSRVLGV